MVLQRLITGMFLFVCVTAHAQMNAQLCKPNEKVVFAFQFKNQKWVSVCVEKHNKYIVYRSGTQNKIDLQYPSNPDTSSWQLLTFDSYQRGGGKQNAAMSFAHLNFKNNGVVYQVYDTWNSEDNKIECGITVTVNDKDSDLKGLVKSRKGGLLSLYDNDNIHLAQDN